jgi:hypothetical protein
MNSEGLQGIGCELGVERRRKLDALTVMAGDMGGHPGGRETQY